MRRPRRLRVVVSGASGMIGTELIRQLRRDGHEVRRLVRRPAAAADEFRWAPAEGALDPGILDGADAVVNLSGAPLNRLPWTRRYRTEIRDSRVRATETLALAIGRADRPPSAFLSASAVGYYGDRPGELLTESAAPGSGFLSEVVRAWEQAAGSVTGRTRLVVFRTGLVIGRGGALAPLTALTRIGLGARIGTGGDEWPWISLYDEAAAIRHLIVSSGLSGAVNLAGPEPATSDRITGLLARKLHRWYALTVPVWAISLALQDAGHQLLLSSQRVSSGKLRADGFRFRHESADRAIDAMLKR